MQKSTLLWVAGISACVPMLAIAQPAEPTKPAAQLKYTSAFADYKPFKDLEPGDWRALNHAVGAAAAKQGVQPSQASQAAPAAAPPATPNAAMPAHDMKSMPGMGHPMQGGKP
ncbi:hypothetical protein F7Q92_15325 [Ideonella dechloratans]|jgi:hypothetical protein|uniref:Uncharacterized protein n=2 Tax=Sphaerotilaceae TaxID=2975441 RepID=A0A643FBQ9_IDEDE|nr:hypothetical protein [Ideonella dechloratans]KAB0579053.1 hypothetical protein F7Q92_15325 [Ideonella dechloratans]UFU10476.1 hypothetical protein LRM40_01785 [Ideonella dechloratans]